MEITRETVKNLAELARIEFTESEEEKYACDLERIVEHVGELQKVNTDGVAPMAGGTFLENEFRVDDTEQLDGEAARCAFPKKEGGYLKVPPVFE